MDMKNYSRHDDGSLYLVEKYLGELGPKSYSFEDLQSFTSNKVGSGGYGEVYKDQFPSGMQAAVKVLHTKDVVEETFMAEVSTMDTVYHRNLIKLYGYCFDNNIKALVYEYMEIGSLDKILYENYLSSSIKWEKLYDIAIKTAKGLTYLHDGCDEQIIHYDIKATNVLLDKNISPKITDFGLAKLMKSFGTMLFEILGKRNNGVGENWLTEQVWSNFKNGQLDELLKDCGITEKNREKDIILGSVVVCSVYSETETFYERCSDDA